MGYNKSESIVKLEESYIKRDNLAQKKYFDNCNLQSIYFSINQLKNGNVRFSPSYLKG